jgi:hypothetical protein
MIDKKYIIGRMQSLLDDLNEMKQLEEFKSRRFSIAVTQFEIAYWAMQANLDENDDPKPD